LREIALGPDGVLAAIGAGDFVDLRHDSRRRSGGWRRSNAAWCRLLAHSISGNAVSLDGRRYGVCIGAGGLNNVNRSFRPSAEQIPTRGGERALPQARKFVIVVVTAQGMAEALALGRKAGLPWDAMPMPSGEHDRITLAGESGPDEGARFYADDDHPPHPQGHRPDAAAAVQRRPNAATAMTPQIVQAVIGEGLGDEDYMAIVKLAGCNPPDRASELMADIGNPAALDSIPPPASDRGGWPLVGLIAGNLFHRLGWDVAVFERTAACWGPRRRHHRPSRIGQKAFGGGVQRSPLGAAPESNFQFDSRSRGTIIAPGRRFSRW
jgi:hypothetical protein